MTITKITGGMIDGINTIDILDSTITNAKMAVDPSNASNLSSGDVPSAQLGLAPVTGVLHEADIALLAFKTQANGSLAKYNLVDQTVDAFEDASGVDASASTGEKRNAANYYSGTEPGPTGGTTTTYGTYKAHTFTTDGTFTTSSTVSVDYFIMAGGGGGGNAGANTGPWGAGGGGGAGGFLTATGTSLTAQDYTITVGDGGTGGLFQNAAQNGISGGNSSIVPVTSGTSYIATGGGAGANSVASSVGLNGGSGGGGCYSTRASGTGTAGPPRQGYDGGTNTYTNSGAGGGGAGAQGGAAGSPAGNGGTGISNDYRDGISGTTIGTHYFGGGGAGGGYNVPSGTGSYGGGNGGLLTGTLNGTSNGIPAIDTSGGGGGGGAPHNTGDPTSGGAGGDGGNGIVVIRYVDSGFATADMTLVSTSTTAQTAPTKASLVLTYTNGSGTAVINTDITAEFSADNGSTYTSMTLASQGTSGGHTILSADDVTRTSTSGTSMRYRIKTLNQSASKETRIQAVSLGWS